MKTLDLFALGIAKMAIGLPLYKYQICTRENYNKASINSNQGINKNNKPDFNTNDKNI